MLRAKGSIILDIDKSYAFHQVDCCGFTGSGALINGLSVFYVFVCVFLYELNRHSRVGGNPEFLAQLIFIKGLLDSCLRRSDG